MIRRIRKFIRRTFYNFQRKIYLEKQLKIAWDRIDMLEDELLKLKSFEDDMLTFKKDIRRYLPREIKFG